MDAIFKLLRSRFTNVDLMHLSDIEDETLKLMMFQNGPSRDEFIKFLVYKYLLDLDPGSEDSQKHNLEYIFVTFGILDKKHAQQFLNGSLPTKLHATTWKKIIEVLIPITPIVISKYLNLQNEIFHEKYDHFHTLGKKHYLPPELVSKLKSKPVISNDDCERIEENLEKIMKIIKEPKSSDANDNNEINSSYNEYKTYTNSELVDSIKDTNLMPIDYLESKFDNIYKLMKADQDLQILAKSLAEQI